MPRGSHKRDQKIQRFWEQRIEAAKKRKQQYTETARDVMSYYKSDHGGLYNDSSVTQGFMKFHEAGVVSVPKIAQMRAALGPRLYYQKPVRNVIPLSDDGVLRGLSRCLEAYLNYTPRESKLLKHFRRAIDDGMLRGRMILETYFDPLLGIVTSRYVSSMDLLIDPDVDCLDDAEWIAFRQREPIWRLKRRIEEQWRLKEIDERFKRVVDEGTDSEVHSILDETDPRDDVPDTNYVIESWVVLSKMGPGFRGAHMKDAERYSDKLDYVKLEIAPGALYPLFEGEWDVPYYLDRDWPIASGDFVETLDELWPESIGGQVISLQKAIDLLTSLRLNSCKNRDRVLVAVDADLETKLQRRIKHGGPAELLPITLKNPGEDIRQKVHAIDMGTGSPETNAERVYLENIMDVTTGVTPVLSGDDVTSAKDRSAMASSIRADATGTRVQDLKLKVQELCTDAARHEAIAVRLMLGPDEVERVVKFKDIRMFFVQITPPGGAVIPVRRPYNEEEAEEGISPERKRITLEDIYPDASTYYDDPVEAIQAAMEVFQALQLSEDPVIMDLLEDLAPMQAQTMDGQTVRNVDPETGLPDTITIGLVTPERIWIDTAGLTAEDLMREFGYDIRSGDGIRADKSMEQQNADFMVQSMVPIMLQNMDYEGVNRVLEIRNEAFEIPLDQRVQLQPPPAPPEGQEKSSE